MGCDKAREFLSRHKIEVTEFDVRKEPVTEAKARSLLKASKRAYAKKGSKVLFFDFAKGDRVEDALVEFLGRSGTMRAPVVLVGDTLFAGFDEETYRKLLT